MPNKKKNTKSDQAINFLQGFFGDKNNKSPVSNIVRASQKRQEAYDKARGK